MVRGILGWYECQDVDRSGLLSMQDRALRLNGRLEVDSVPGRGTRLVLRVPLRRAETAT